MNTRARRWILPLMLALCLSRGAAGGEAGAGEEDGWGLLFANQPGDAAKRFAEPGGGEPLAMLSALEGRYACAWVQADFETAWKVALEQAWLAAPLPDGLGAIFFRRLDHLADGLRRQQDFAEFVEGVLPDAKTHPAVQRLALDAMTGILRLRRTHEEARALEAKDGRVRLYAAVVGPFCDPRGFDVDRADVFESQPGLDAYTDARGKAVALRRNVPAGRSGWLDLSDAVSSAPMDGAVYALALVESDAAKDAVLSVAAPAATRIWLQGLPVFRGDAYRFDYRRSTREVCVRLRAGINAVLVKCAARAVVCLRFLAPDGGIAPGLSWREWQADACVPCVPLRGFLLSQPAASPLFTALEASDAPLTAKTLWRAAAYEDEAAIDRAREVWEAFLQGHPRSLYVLTQAASARLRESSFHIDAASRLTKEAMDLLARAQAVDGKDYATLFLLGRQHARNNQAEAALELLKQAEAICPEAPLARIELARLYRAKGWQALVEEEYKRLLALSPEWDLEWAQVLAATGRGGPAREIRDRAWDAGRVGEWTRFSLLKEQGAWAEARQTLEAWKSAYPTEEKQYRRAVLDLALAQGDSAAAEAVLREELAAAPESSRPALDLGELFLRQGKRAEALAWFQTACQRNLENEAVDVELVRRMRKLRDEAWPLLAQDLSLQEISHQGVRKEDHPRANYAVVLRSRICRIYADRSAEKLIHNAIKVFDKEGIDALGEMSVPRESDALLYCRTIQPDGSVFVPASVENLELGKATSMYNVQPGSVLEYAYRDSDPGGRAATFADAFVAEHMNVPVIRGRYVLIVPKALAAQVSLRVVPETWAPEVEEKGDDIVYRWEVRDRAGRKVETFLPTDDEVFAGIRAEVRGPRYEDLASLLPREAPIRANAAVEKQALEIIGKATNDVERAQLVYSWIATEIQDAAGAQTARDVLALRAGGNDAKARLCQAMLQALGIESHFAQVNARFCLAGEDSLRQRARQAGRFGGSLLHVRLPEARDLWLQFQTPARNYRLADIGYRLIGAPALETTGRGVELVSVREELEETARDTEIVVGLQEDGSAVVRAALVYHGSWAGRMRTTAEQPQRGPLEMERLAATFFPKLTLEESDFPDGSERAKHPLPERSPFIFRFRGRVKQFCHPEGEQLTFAPFLGRPLGAERYVTPLPREHPFEIGRDLVVSQRLTFRAPSGWGFAEIPADCYWVTDFGIYVMDFTVEGDTLTASRFLILPAQALKPNEYEACVRWLELVGTTERQTAALARIPGAEAACAVYDQGPMDVRDLTPFRPRYWPVGLAPAGGL